MTDTLTVLARDMHIGDVFWYCTVTDLQPNKQRQEISIMVEDERGDEWELVLDSFEIVTVER